MTPALRQVLGKPGWVLAYQPDLQFDFVNGRAWKGNGSGGGAVVPVESLLTVSRASTAMIDDLSGNWRTFLANTLCRSNKGTTSWEARTNLALWSRDLTNAVWAKVTMTAELTATGIDGVSNSATKITATGALSTILQTVVQASTADMVSFFVRRRTGTGAIEITGNGFVAATDITAAVDAAATATIGGWYRAIISATLVNPVLGLRLTTSGDEVDVDFGQLEAGIFATSPILTTTVAVTRAADVVVVTNPPGFGVQYSQYMAGEPKSPTNYTTSQVGMSVDDGTTTNRSQIYRNSTTGVPIYFSSNGSASATGNVAWAQFTNGSLAVRFAPNSQFGIFTLGVFPPTTVATINNIISQIHIGVRADGIAHFNGDITIAALWSKVGLKNEDLSYVITR